MNPNFMDDADCGNFFDHIDDLIEFPPENDTSNNGLVGSAGDCKNFSSLWDEPLPDADPLFSGNDNLSASGLSTELSLPYEEIAQLEWLSTFSDDSFSYGGQSFTGKGHPIVKKEYPPSQFQTSSPVSVLESSSSSSSSSSCSGGKIIPLSPTHRGAQRARSKRPRPATFNPRSAMQLISLTSSFSETPLPLMPYAVPSESENIAESGFVKNLANPLPAGEQKKKKKIKLTVPKVVETNENSPPQVVRKCLHCEITKTPQWRAGPMGPKTLCNACGVRYKSGRLFPEYRPAASPTFVPALHSNSHKKVVEMRNKINEKNGAVETVAKTSVVSQIDSVAESKPLVERI
ncbi:OLC1v1026043C1 [Oldenlandia corymbosa var. corymbosa]|uniref:GATA transcription factor n=1 Tax=Oldenlandia corymbosa var. corymbosa TaxID=529605 RepID=A0AAV1C8H5_OLDCO|nr:OLC1v1026043C1 [Oldenlandia corymbosa var. corymbosa]